MKPVVLQAFLYRSLCWCGDKLFFSCSTPQVPLEKVFGSNVHKVVAHLNVEGQHRGAVAAALEAQRHEQHQQQEEVVGASAPGSQPEAAAAAGDHSHHHHHDHHAAHSHDHEHQEHSHKDHHHEHKEHHHDHHEHKEHSHKDHSHDCAGEGCQDAEHGEEGHHHHHHHHHTGKPTAETRAASRFGIRSFVYSRRRPFHPKRWVPAGGWEVGGGALKRHFLVLQEPSKV